MHTVKKTVTGYENTRKRLGSKTVNRLENQGMFSFQLTYLINKYKQVYSAFQVPELWYLHIGCQINTLNYFMVALHGG